LQQSSSALNGHYALSASGVTGGSSPARFLEAGSIVAAGNAVSSGILDVNSSTVSPVSTVTGLYTPPSSGRGTLTITPSGSAAQTFAYYPIDATHAKLIAADGSNVTGDLFTQGSGPFSNATLKGRYAFSASGSQNGNGNPFGLAGVFSLDGNVNVTDQQFDGIQQTAFDFNSGAYHVTHSDSGRTTLSWTYNGGTTLHYVLYPRGDGGFIIMESDGVFQGTGMALPQANAAVVNLLTIQGGWAFGLGGATFATPSSAQRFVGQGVISSNNSLVGNVAGDSISQTSPFTLSQINVNASTQRYQLAVSSDAATFTGGTMILYRINDTEAFMVESNAGTRTRTGFLQRQY
jgi:hypothetical protein